MWPRAGEYTCRLVLSAGGWTCRQSAALPALSQASHPARRGAPPIRAGPTVLGFTLRSSTQLRASGDVECFRQKVVHLDHVDAAFAHHLREGVVLR